LRELLDLKEKAGSRRLQVSVILTATALPKYVKSYAKRVNRLDDIREYVPALERPSDELEVLFRAHKGTSET
jgi:hypothetical protein